MFCTGKWLIWTKSILSCSSFSWTFLMKYNNTPMIYCITCKYSNTWMLKGLYIIGRHCALTCTSLWSDFHVRVQSPVKSQSPLFHWLQMLLFPGTWFYRWKLFHKKKTWELVCNGSFLCFLVIILWWQPLSPLHPESDHINTTDL